MKAILIDSKNKTVTEVKISGDLQSIYKIMGVDMIEVATYLSDEDCIYCDEEGMMKSLGHFFEVKGAHQPFAGNGLVVGTSDDGDTASTKMSVEDVRPFVSFTSIYELKARYANA